MVAPGGLAHAGKMAQPHAFRCQCPEKKWLDSGENHDSQTETRPVVTFDEGEDAIGVGESWRVWWHVMTVAGLVCRRPWCCYTFTIWEVSWNRGTPNHHSNGIFDEINHPTMRVAHGYGNPHESSTVFSWGLDRYWNLFEFGCGENNNKPHIWNCLFTFISPIFSDLEDGWEFILLFYPHFTLNRFCWSGLRSFHWGCKLFQVVQINQNILTISSCPFSEGRMFEDVQPWSLYDLQWKVILRYHP